MWSASAGWAPVSCLLLRPCIWPGATWALPERPGSCGPAYGCLADYILIDHNSKIEFLDLAFELINETVQITPLYQLLWTAS